MNRKLLAAVILVFAAAAGNAQTIEHLAVASQFNNWKVPGTVALVAGSNPLVPFAPCFVQGDPNHQFPAVAASTPLKIVDPGNPAIDEVVTPTSIVVGSTCTATLSTTNAHTPPYYFVSGTFGLQEAINNWASSSALNIIELDTTWHQSGGGYATIYNAVGSTGITLLDVAVSPNQAFRWNGTHYLVNYTVNAGTITVAAGAAAGTGPTIANTTSATPYIWTVTLTTGTSPTTGTLFTETFGTAFPSPGANCVVQSVGVNPGPAITVTQTSTTVETISVTTAPAASTAYIYNGVCN